MPTYVYECRRGHQAEEVRKIADRDVPMFCHCGADVKMERVEIAGPTAYVTKPGVGDRSPFSRDRAGR